MAWGWWQGMLGPRDILPGGTQCPLGIPEPSAEEAAWLQPPRPAPPSPPMPAPLSPGESDAPGPAEHSEAVSKGLSLLKTGRWRLAERAAGGSKADPRSPPPQPSPRVPAASKAQPDLARLAQEKDKVVTNPCVVCTGQIPLRSGAGAGRGGTVPAAVRVLLPSRGSPGWAAPEGQPPVSLPLSAGKTAKPPPR